MSPRLPPELEREIFEIAALAHSRTAPPLLRVARRVFLWIEPLLYQSLMTVRKADVDGVRHALQHKPGHLEHVRHLFLYIGREAFEDGLSIDEGHVLLARCPNLESLYIGGFAPAAEAARYIALVKNLGKIRKWCSSSFIDMFHILHHGQPHQPFFQSLSHLILLEEVLPPETLEGLPMLPALTHMCLRNPRHYFYFRDLLQHCRHLQVLVGIYHQFRTEFRSNPPCSDDRFVIYLDLSWHFWADWETGLRGETDIWAAAERFIARKKRREVAGFILEDPLPYTYANAVNLI
ncbi:hypothetical protein HMN09_00544500 [Mycena chlorophos]|uniref:Uncharacterized protein n=1 Tax=Mycena chlorophos TaxID=658473 RepID=A0A8H6TA24_MYCCL|nr:hypothetical protein HMN09_00544500 [Mycena chlorophos]